MTVLQFRPVLCKFPSWARHILTAVPYTRPEWEAHFTSETEDGPCDEWASLVVSERMPDAGSAVAGDAHMHFLAVRGGLKIMDRHHTTIATVMTPNDLQSAIADTLDTIDFGAESARDLSVWQRLLGTDLPSARP